MIYKVQFRDLNRQYDKYKDEIDSSIKDIVSSADFILGKAVLEFEEELASYVGVKHCITCANGTDAMSLVLMALGIKQGDAVFVPNYTFFSTAEVVSHIRATPIFVDVDENTYNMDSNSLRSAIDFVRDMTSLIPRVIITVDLFGLCANYDEITKISLKNGLFLLEDAAQGFGGSINGKRACSFGDAATTSFYPAKPLGCYGDGGAIFTNNAILANQIKSLRSHGVAESRYSHKQIGLNSRLDTLQASILRVKLRALVNHELNDVNNVANTYYSLLSGIVKTPKIPLGFYSSFAQYTIQLESRGQRDSLAKYLNSKGIPTIVYYPKTMHQQEVYSNHTKVVDLSISEKLTEVSLSLPIHPYQTLEETKLICKSISEFINN